MLPSSLRDVILVDLDVGSKLDKSHEKMSTQTFCGVDFPLETPYLVKCHIISLILFFLSFLPTLH